MTEVLAFKSALRRGLGRAMLLLRKTPDAAELRDELLNACKKNIVYDPQCEISRALYIYNLIHEVGQEQIYWNVLKSDLLTEDTSITEKYYNNMQKFRILCLIATADPWLDRAKLKDIITKPTLDDFTRDCIGYYVELQGIDGFTFCFQTYAKVIGRKEWNEDWSFRELTDILIKRDGLDVATNAISKARAADPELDRLLHLLDADDGAEKQAEALLDRNAVTTWVGQNKRIPWGWIRAANQDDLSWAANKLLEARNDKEILAYLRVFGRRPFPEPIERLFPFVRSADAQIAHVAVYALGQLRDASVRALALALLSEDSNPAGAVRLLRSNFQPGDFKMIETLLTEAVDDEDAYHNICLATLDILSAAPAALQESQNALLHLYENGPCSNCRHHVVAHLAAINAVPDWMAEECQYDCVPETAALVRAP